MAKTHGNFNVTILKDKLRNIGSERVLNWSLILETKTQKDRCLLDQWHQFDEDENFWPKTSGRSFASL